jgi:hypothetical protein
MIYLDTHVILWLFARKGEGLSIRSLNLIDYSLGRTEKCVEVINRLSAVTRVRP